MDNRFSKTLKITLKEERARLSSLRKYYPFFKVNGYTFTSIDGCEHVNMGEVTMALISFLFYEGKLANSKITYINIRDYLEMLLNELYEVTLTPENLDSFVYTVLSKIENKDGEGYTLEFPSFSKNGETTPVTRYIKSPTDERTGQKNYELTSDAIDFFLETKEFGEESKITISLLLLKKLIESGEFDSALLSLTNVNAEVIKQISKVYEIEIGLMYGGNSGYQSFLDYRNLANNRQKEEEDLFRETMEKIRNLREDYAKKVSRSELGVKEENALRCLDEMDKEMIKTVELHQQLLGKIVLLSRRADDILKLKRVNLLRPIFDFSRHLDKIGTVGTINGVRDSVSMLFPLNIRKSFSLDRINDMLIVKSNKTDEEHIIEEDNNLIINTKVFNETINKRVLHNYEYIIECIYDLLKNRDEIDMREIISISSNSQIENILKNPDFVGFVADYLRKDRDNTLSTNDKGKKNSKREKESSLEQAIELFSSKNIVEFDFILQTIPGEYVEIAPGFNMTNIKMSKKER